LKSEIKINKETKEDLLRNIKLYFENERNEELGDLAASMVLDFIIKDMAPYFYNQGVLDAYKYLSDRVEDVLSIQKIV
jgi:uncharacterized protein (DUF2164 family)